MRIQIDKFLKNYGLRTVANLLRPRLHSLSKLEFPHNTTYHYMADNSAVIGPNQKDPLFKDLQGKMWIEHKHKLDIVVGSPRRTSVIGETLANQYRRQNRFFRPLRRDESVKLNALNVAVFNYSMLNHLWRYPSNFKTSYFRWANNAATFWEGVREADERFKRNQFIEIHLPDTIPKFTQFKQLTRSQTQELMGVFNSPSTLNIFDLYCWAGEERERSYMSALTDEQFNRINFFVRVKGSFFVFNLGLLNSWIKHKDPKETVSTESFVNELGLEEYFVPSIMQRKIVSLFTTLVEYGNSSDELTEVEEPNDDLEDTPDTSDEDQDEELEAEQQDDDDVKPGSFLDLSQMEVTYDPPPESELEKTVLIIDNEPDDIDLANTSVLKVDSTINKKAEEVSDSVEVKARTVARRAGELASAGAISSRTFDQAVNDAQSYTKLDDPFGSGLTIAEAMEYGTDDLELPPGKLVGNVTVSDESLNRSVLKDMTNKYVNEILPKDILQAIMGVQQQGVSVTDVKMETVEDAMNHYQIFTVTVKPVRGKPSQLRFRIPVIDREGRFRANGTQYKKRFQVGDLPIRKVNPKRVALTSYYNKTFVSRSPRQDNNFDGWLVRQINLKRESGDITGVNYAEQDFSKYHLPRIYSALSATFSDFTCGDYHFYLRYEDRLKKYETRDLGKVEVNGMTLLGHRISDDALILTDHTATVYIHENEQLEPIGTVLELLGIDPTKAPVESVVITIANKILPLGFVLAYRSGLSELLKELEVEYTVHPRRSRYQVSPDQYTLEFDDEVLVLNKDDYRSTLILSGLRRYRHSLKAFSRWDFDRKDVYYRILEASGVSLNYVKEIDALYSAWMDPITEGLLVEMGEPTTFHGLLHRSVELLMDDWSPAEVDGAYMRYKGYESMAGMVYNSLARAVKNYNNREGSAVQHVTMDQHEVWKRITQDPTVSTIEESNPLANLREQEAMTASGDGGRSAESMVARTRVYHDSDIGVVSEATVDSSNVGIIAYLTANPNFTNMRGVTRPVDFENDGNANLFSSAILLAPASETDD